MPNDVSYFKVPGDSTTYQFNDPDAESRIGALESTVNDQAADIADNTTAINANTSAIGSLNRRLSYVSGVSTHTLITSGLYYCASDCTDIPFPGTWVVEVISNTAGTNVKQIARLMASEGAEFEQHLVSGTWSGWVDVGRMKPFSGAMTTTQYFRKAGNANYGSFLIMGTFGGIGGVIIGCTVSNGSLGSVINLLTGAAWSTTNLTITYGVTDGIGYVGLKTTSASNSSGVIIGG